MNTKAEEIACLVANQTGRNVHTKHTVNGTDFVVWGGSESAVIRLTSATMDTMEPEVCAAYIVKQLNVEVTQGA